MTQLRTAATRAATTRTFGSHRRRARLRLVAVSAIAAAAGGAAFAATLPGSASAAPTATRTVNVSSAAQLTAALADAKPGDTIKLANGTYQGQFKATADGTTSSPITLTGGSGAVLTSNGGNGYGLWLSTAPHWNIKGLTVADSNKGIVLDASPYVTIDGATVRAIGYEGVHFRSGSHHGVIKNSSVRDTGTTHPNYGEGVYIGSANGNWDQYAGPTGVDASDYVQVLNNRIGPNVAAEGIDIKEGTKGGVVRGNILDGTGEKNQNSGDSTIDVKGDKYVIDGNTVSHPYTDGFQVHNVYDPYGCGNAFTNNKFTLGSAPGYGINVTDNSGCAIKNTVASSNTSSGGKGLTNIPVGR
ncbi:right-handed parallel beta-helix repeat-containing protein [Streptomyces sp. NPDC006733]|uniref:right-handed parallel beta-helix repeat-containing protein n=1 Tax=Streptomyces sp. NPDC006733 TaxID=3155460 RepID=UPI0033DDFFE7